MALIIAGERSGVGKTTVTLALLSYLSKRGLQVQSFKVGPDYIDPMFHKYVTNRACRNLDPVLTSESYVKKCFYKYSRLSEYTLIEGVMGLFDGVKTSPLPLSLVRRGVDNFASTAHIAKLLNLPVLLVIDCSRLSGSVAAIVHGYSSFDKDIQIAGVVLNRVGSDRHLSLLKNSLQSLPIPIIGVLKRQDNITIRDRHLGLVPTAEIPELNQLIDKLANLGENCFDWENLLPLLQNTEISPPSPPSSPTHSLPKIAVAYDKAFNFYYQDNLDLLQELGAELIFWSPLKDKNLPKDIRGMYFGGGFPEVFAQQLAENNRTRDAVKAAIVSGMPTIAECGGLMYLCEQIVDMNGKSWEMVGVLPTKSVMDKRLTLGYRRATALQDSLLVDAGKTIYGHEFHRSSLIVDSDKPLYQTYRFDCDEFMGKEGWNSPPNIHASYIHMHWGNSREIPQKFVDKCRVFDSLGNVKDYLNLTPFPSP
ncbi:cobyrinic acid a,c-diamide synthase [Rivularia sp. PCC 7116]|uniref:cobyrinate a,c-diamide synthase n=1 Tax=Rivularia sp. PCC 7116 TaxID=373994 RepID=UPI00029EF021|nr:cobyrinate a,c-diamide synthase [Rivularia sp. PCC 7116]AFY53810.1 cobyrinic acid a,c-diamide synthase [Rivularia sp. PCC 7116]